MSLARVGAACAFATVVALAIWACVADSTLDPALRHGWSESLVVLGLTTVVAATGWLIATRSDAPRIGWLLLGLAALLPNYDSLVADTLGPDGDGPFLARLVIGVVAFSWLAVFATVATLAIVFPNGRPTTRRWRLVLLASAVGWTATALGILVREHPYDGGRYPDVTSPVGGLDSVATLLFVPGYVVSTASLPLALAALVTRFRRSAGIERLQLKWLAYSVVLLPVTLLFCTAVGLLTGLSPDEGGAFGAVLTVLYVALVLGVVGSIAIALTRHGLYRIDWIVNRTLVYGVLTTLLAAAWIGIALGLGTAIGGGSAWSASLATAAIAFGFLPLRRGLQGAVDRRLARARFEAVAFVRSLEDEIREGRAEPERIGARLRDALHDPRAVLLLRLAEEDVLVRCDGGSPDDVDPALAATPIVREGREIGVLLHDPRLAERHETLSAVLGAAGLAIELARLRVELRRRLREVEESRTRIVRAGYEERRRLERDLHDGAQQRLVGLGIRLRRIQRSLPREARVLGPALDEAVGEVGLAITDLRTIASGLRPARLDDGLAAALADLARAAPVPVSVDAAVERLPETVEAAAYYVACEAVTNAVKHGSPQSIHVAAARRDGTLSVVVVDDGRGGACVGAGTGGLAGLVDRVEAQGGRLAVESAPGRGTRIEAKIPCAS